MFLLIILTSNYRVFLKLIIDAELWKQFHNFDSFPQPEVVEID